MHTKYMPIETTTYFEMLCVTSFSWGDIIHISIHPRWGAHNRTKYRYTKFQFGESMSFIGVTYKNMGEGLLTGAEIT